MPKDGLPQLSLLLYFY